MIYAKWFVVAAPFLATCLFSQPVEIRPASAVRSAGSTIRANSNLVLVPVTVTSRSGVAMSGLGAGAFSVYEDKVPQTVVSFGNQDIPCSVGIVLDLSGSMRHKLRMAAAAVREFLEVANPADEAFVLTVSTRPQTVSEFTSDFGLLQNRLLETKPGGGTALIDTVYLGLTRIKDAQNPHRALLIVSDGMDNESRYSKAELMRVAQEADVQIYTIGIAESPAGKKPIELVQGRAGLALLDGLAERTGGLSFAVGTFDETAPAAKKIGHAIRDQYLLGYHPTDRDNSGKWRTIQVKVNVPQVRVSARRGYYSN